MSDVTVVDVILDGLGPSVIEVVERGPQGLPGADGTIAAIPGNTILGNNTGSPAVPSALTPSQGRDLLKAQRTFNLTNGDGDVNKFEVLDGEATGSYAALVFQSKLLSEGFGTLQVLANAEDGFLVSQQGNGLSASTQFAGVVSASGKSIGVDADGYYVSDPAAFRSAVGFDAALQTALDDFVAAVYARTTDPGVAGAPWNDGGVWTFSTGFTSGSMNFSQAAYSQYLSLIEDL